MESTPFRTALQHLIEDEPSLVAELLYERHYAAAMEMLGINKPLLRLLRE